MKWEAVLLAGGKLEEKFLALGKVPGKAYLDLNGKPMVSYVIDILKQIPRLPRIVAVTPREAPALSGTISVPGGNTLFESLSIGMNALSPETNMALIATCDIPLLSRESTEDFLDRCERENAGFFYSFVSKTDSEKKFPGIPHTYVKLDRESYCGGGLMAIVPRDFPALKKLAEEATRNRKNVLALARIFGISSIVKLILGKLTVAELEKKASDIVGFPTKGILSPFPEVAFNVDDPEALKLASSFLRNEHKVKADELKRQG